MCTLFDKLFGTQKPNKERFGILYQSFLKSKKRHRFRIEQIYRNKSKSSLINRSKFLYDIPDSMIFPNTTAIDETEENADMFLKEFGVLLDKDYYLPQEILIQLGLNNLIEDHNESSNEHTDSHLDAVRDLDENNRAPCSTSQSNSITGSSTEKNITKNSECRRKKKNKLDSGKNSNTSELSLKVEYHQKSTDKNLNSTCGVEVTDVGKDLLKSSQNLNACVSLANPEKNILNIEVEKQFSSDDKPEIIKKSPINNKKIKPKQKRKRDIVSNNQSKNNNSENSLRMSTEQSKLFKRNNSNNLKRKKFCNQSLVPMDSELEILNFSVEKEQPSTSIMNIFASDNSSHCAAPWTNNVTRKMNSQNKLKHCDGHQFPTSFNNFQNNRLNPFHWNSKRGRFRFNSPRSLPHDLNGSNSVIVSYFQNCINQSQRLIAKQENILHSLMCKQPRGNCLSNIDTVSANTPKDRLIVKEEENQCLNMSHISSSLEEPSSSSIVSESVKEASHSSENVSEETSLSSVSNEDILTRKPNIFLKNQALLLESPNRISNEECTLELQLKKSLSSSDNDTAKNFERDTTLEAFPENTSERETTTDVKNSNERINCFKPKQKKNNSMINYNQYEIDNNKNNLPLSTEKSELFEKEVSNEDTNNLQRNYFSNQSSLPIDSGLELIVNISASDNFLNRSTTKSNNVMEKTKFQNKLKRYDEHQFPTQFTNFQNSKRNANNWHPKRGRFYFNSPRSLPHHLNSSDSVIVSYFQNCINQSQRLITKQEKILHSLIHKQMRGNYFSNVETLTADAPKDHLLMAEEVNQCSNIPSISSRLEGQSSSSIVCETANNSDEKINSNIVSEEVPEINHSNERIDSNYVSEEVPELNYSNERINSNSNDDSKEMPALNHSNERILNNSVYKEASKLTISNERTDSNSLSKEVSELNHSDQRMNGISVSEEVSLPSISNDILTRNPNIILKNPALLLKSLEKKSNEKCTHEFQTKDSDTAKNSERDGTLEVSTEHISEKETTSHEKFFSKYTSSKNELLKKTLSLNETIVALLTNQKLCLEQMASFTPDKMSTGSCSKTDTDLLCKQCENIFDIIHRKDLTDAEKIEQIKWVFCFSGKRM